MPISSVGYNVPYHSVFAPPSLHFIVSLKKKKRLVGSFYDTFKTQSQIKA